MANHPDASGGGAWVHVALSARSQWRELRASELCGAGSALQDAFTHPAVVVAGMGKKGRVQTLLE